MEGIQHTRLAPCQVSENCISSRRFFVFCLERNSLADHALAVVVKKDLGGEAKTESEHLSTVLSFVHRYAMCFNKMDSQTPSEPDHKTDELELQK